MSDIKNLIDMTLKDAASAGAFHHTAKKADAELARLKSAQHLLGQYGFAIVFNGGNGTRYLRCRRCKGDNASDTDQLNRDNVRHQDGCEIAAALDAK